MNKCIFLIIATALIACFSTKAQVAGPIITLQRDFGGNNIEQVNGRQLLINTNDGGFIIACSTFTLNNGDISGGIPVLGGEIRGIWVAKIDSSFNIVWKHTFSGSRGNSPNCLEKTSDGNYILVSTVLSSDGDMVGNHGSEDIWVVKFNDQGQVIWKRCYGGSGDDFAGYIQKVGNNNGYIISGMSNSTDGDLTGSSDYIAWIIRIDESGNIIWQNRYTGPYGQYNTQTVIRNTSDGNFIFLSQIMGSPYGTYDLKLTKIDTTGNILWQKTYGNDNNFEWLGDLKETPDGGCLLAWYNSSNSGPTGLPNDAILAKLSSTGDILWQKSYGGSGWDIFNYLQVLPDNSIVLAGYTGSNDGDIAFNNGSYDYWVVKCSSDGSLIWSKTFGGSSDEYATAVTYDQNGNIFVFGYSGSNDKDVIGNHGGSVDAWLIRFDGSTILCPGASITLAAKLTGATYQWQADAGLGYSNISDNSIFQGTNQNTFHLINIPTSMYGYKFRCLIDGSSFGPEYVIKFQDGWNGSVSKAWENPANWNCGIVPDLNTDVIVNAGAGNAPEISSNVSCRSLTILSNATILVKSGFTLTIGK